MSIRKVVCCGLAALSLGSLSSSALAQAYPDHAIRIVVGFPPGQTTDATARSLAAKMSETLQQAVYVDNKPGAGGSLAAEAVKNAAPDGYTLLLSSTATLAINPSLYRKLSYDPIKDFEPVARIAGSPLALFTATSTPVSNLQETLSFIKAKGGRASYGSPGNGTTAHIAMEMLKQDTGADITHVPYKGSPAMINDIVAGRVEFAFDATGSIVPFSKGGRIKLLGVTSAKRLPSVPSVPTIAEQGVPGYEVLAWTGMLAPKGTPASVIQKLNAAVNKALKDPEILAQYELTGTIAAGGTPAEFSQFLQSEVARWGKAVKASGAHID